MDEQTNNINETVEEKKDDNKLGLDPASAEDRKKIVKGYKKSLRNRITAPLLNSTKGINPIDVIREEEEREEKAKQIQEQRENDNVAFDMYDMYNYRLKKIESKINLCLSLARIALLLGIAALFAVMFLMVTKL